MSRLDPNKVEALFQEALDLDLSSRDEFLTHCCREDTALRLELDSLLRAVARVESNPAWSCAVLEPTAAPQLERYEIRERIGSGGMGSVYRALRREGDFSKEVALKIVHSDHPALVQRFHQERQILATLDHPNIARLLDVGATGDGSPFLAMDFVEGKPIDSFVKERGLGQRDILHLFRKIAAAVAYAHRNLIVHRDLKPANILVTAAGEPKLLDFGIAKVIDSDAGQTRTRGAAMTPEYASPEQMSGGVITTASDIYSLGVLLHYLLSGLSPYGNTASPAELAAAITSAAPRQLKGVDADVANIVQMALRKEPERRYSSVEQFSEDVRRYLEGYPVLARTDTAAYRLTRFIRRNALALCASIVIAALAAAGIASTIRQQRIAQRHFNDVRSLANSYLFEVYDSLQNLQGATATRQLVVKKALTYLDDLSREQENDPGLNRELASAYFRVGTLLGEPGMPNLGDPEGALSSFYKALKMRERLAASNAVNFDLQLEVSESERAVGNLLVFKGDTAGAITHIRKAVTLAESLVSARPSDLKARDALATGYTILANVTGSNEYANLGNWQEAEELYNKAQALREKIAKENPSDRMNRLYWSAIFEKIAPIYRSQNKNPLAIKAFQKAIEIDESLVKEDAANGLYKRELAVDNRSLSLTYVAEKKLPEAKETGDRSAALFEALAVADPKNVQAEEEVADSWYSQGFVLEKSHNSEGALERYEASVAKYRKLMADHPGLYPRGMRTAYQLIAGLAAAQGDVVRATAAAEQELQIDDRLLKISPEDIGPQLNRGVALYQIGQAHQTRAAKIRDKSEWRQTIEWGQRSLDVWSDLKRRGKLNASYSAFLTRTETMVAEARKALSDR